MPWGNISAYRVVCCQCCSTRSASNHLGHPTMQANEVMDGLSFSSAGGFRDPSSSGCQVVRGEDGPAAGTVRLAPFPTQCKTHRYSFFFLSRCNSADPETSVLGGVQVGVMGYIQMQYYAPSYRS